jgi:hypothetical protein
VDTRAYLAWPIRRRGFGRAGRSRSFRAATPVQCSARGAGQVAGLPVTGPCGVYQRRYNGQKLRPGEYVICSDEKTSIQYTSFRFTQHLVDAGIDASIGTVGDALDNALAESTNLHEVETATNAWVDWYNNRRLHGACGYRPPSHNLIFPPDQPSNEPGGPRGGILRPYGPQHRAARGTGQSARGQRLPSRPGIDDVDHVSSLRASTLAVVMSPSVRPEPSPSITRRGRSGRLMCGRRALLEPSCLLAVVVSSGPADVPCRERERSGMRAAMTVQRLGGFHASLGWPSHGIHAGQGGAPGSSGMQTRAGMRTGWCLVSSVTVLMIYVNRSVLRWVGSGPFRGVSPLASVCMVGPKCG